MAPIRTGSVSSFTDSSNVGSVSITIPADAEVLIVGVSGYQGTANYFSGGSMTINGAAMTAIAADGSTSLFMGAMFYKVLPSTGAQTLAWDWSGTSAPTDGVLVAWACYKGIDTASAVRSTSGSQQASNPHTSALLTAQTDDLIVAFEFQYASVDTALTWTDATEVTELTSFGVADGGWAEASPTADQTVSASGNESADGGMLAIVLKPSSGGGGGSSSAKSLLLMGVGLGVRMVAASHLREPLTRRKIIQLIPAIMMPWGKR